MPSQAYINFLQIRIDVLKLIETHSYFSQNRPGRKALGHLTRSAIVMLCAAWERYNEDLLIESISIISDNVNDINLLNKVIRQTISKKVKKDKKETKPIELAGDGWKEVWLKYAEQETLILNTPKSEQLKDLFKNYLGFVNFTHFWLPDSIKIINAFVKLRGNIAHNGKLAGYIRMDTLGKFQDKIMANVIQIDGNIHDQIQTITNGHQPWTKEYFRDLSRYK